MVLAGSLDGFGTFNALMLSLTRLPYAMAEDGSAAEVLRQAVARSAVGERMLCCWGGRCVEIYL